MQELQDPPEGRAPEGRAWLLHRSSNWSVV